MAKDKTGDRHMLRLFVDLYREHNLAENGGIDWRASWQSFTRIQVGERGEFTVWGFAEGSPTVNSSARFAAPFIDWKSTDPKRGMPFFNCWDTLVRTGLIEIVPHLLDGETPEAEIIHAYATGAGEPIERELAVLAQQFGESLIAPWQPEKAEQHAGEMLHLAPVLRHIANVQMVGIARLRYRPQTASTATWYARVQERSRRYVQEYRSRLGLPALPSPESRPNQTASCRNLDAPANMQHQGVDQ